ncbi:MAG: hypothetical protein RLZZ450_4309 [Pseudomonadota bacterium]
MESKASVAWSDELVPIANAVTFADDRMILLSIEIYDETTNVRAIAETTVSSFLSFNPDWWTEVIATCELQLPAGGKFVAGEGAQGADGFIAKSDAQGRLEFSVFLDRSNPFVELSISADGSQLNATNNCGVVWHFDVKSPWIIQVGGAGPGDSVR